MIELFECVPNVSEGRNAETIASCAEAIRASGATLAHQTSDADHNRSVFTFFGDAATIERAAALLACACVEHIDLRDHKGVHPRIGALDVFPVVPMRDATIERATVVARMSAQMMWQAAGLPSMFYGEAASNPARRDLPNVRRGDFEGLPAREAAGERPDAGDRLYHPTAGCVAAGSRRVLIAFNIRLSGISLVDAKKVARGLRESSGGLKSVRALALQTGDNVDLSFNLTDPSAVPLRRLVSLAERMVTRAGGRLQNSELIGLVPQASIEGAVAAAFGGDAGDGENSH